MDTNIELCLGWSQSYIGLKCHMEEALKEKKLNVNKATDNPPIALFSQKYFNQINELDNNKIYDYCFIGSINSNNAARQWVIDFTKKHFTNKSIFINTDNEDDWVRLGQYDYTNIIKGFNPKKEANYESKKVQYRIVNENKDYFERMCQSKFVLCPEGDAPWSFRFYETIMCKSIPIVESWHHTYRTKEEADLKYKYILNKNILNKNIEDIIDYKEYVNKNIEIFKKISHTIINLMVRATRC
jgi:hypothetical protein